MQHNSPDQPHSPAGTALGGTAPQSGAQGPPLSPTPRLSDADRTILHALLNPGIGIGVLLQDTGLSFADFADWCARPD
ncbi:MAG: hypothetical protein WAZ94_04315, partial [Phycisphaerales bacterium]